MKYIYFNDSRFLFLLIFGIFILIIESILILENYTFYQSVGGFC